MRRGLGIAMFGGALLIAYEASAFWEKSLLSFGAVPSPSPPPSTTQVPLTVSSNGRYLQRNGTPFLLVGDSAWELQAVTNLNPVGGDGGNNIQNYLNTRSGQGFNAFLMTFSCDYIVSGTNFACNDLLGDGAGNVAFTGLLSGCGGTTPDCYDMTTPSTAFFQRLCGTGAAENSACEAGSIVGRAAVAGMYVAILIPLEGGGSGATFNMLTNNGATRINQFGQYAASIFKNQWNVIWWLGDGDFQGWQTDGNSALVANFAAGLRTGGDNHVITSQLNYYNSTVGDDTTSGGIGSVVNTNGVYSYYPLYQPFWHAYNANKGPAILAESQYDALDSNGNQEPLLNSSNCNQGYSALTACVAPSTVRKTYWWAFLAGASGFFYGEDTIEPNWYNNITKGRPGDFANVWKTVITAQQWQNLVPDQSASVLTNPGSQFGSPPTYPDFNACPNPCMTGNTYSVASYANTAQGATVIAYSPGNGPSAYTGSSTVNALTIDMTKFPGTITASWYDPTNGTSSSAGSGLSNTGTHTFTPPGTNAQGDTDWVLVVNSH